MFGSLSDKLSRILKKLKGQGHLSSREISDGLGKIRIALLKADVNYKIAKKFIADISKRALGQEVLESLTPGQQIVKIVSEELTKLMGESCNKINLDAPTPVFVMLVGLQGSGKTTTASKLSVFLRREGRKPYLVSVDIYRPAAIKQLKILGSELDIPVYNSECDMTPINICKMARIEAAKKGCDTLILDTAGRLYDDETMMRELINIKNEINPSDILIVADAMTGQDAVNIAKEFDDKLNIGGIVLTKMDGDARGGAALSMKTVTGKPIKFIGTGEKANDFELFYPDRMASRILGMGDILSVIDRAQIFIDKKKAAQFENKIRKNKFSLEDFKEQILQVKKMGSIYDLIQLIPGVKKLKHMKELNVDEHEFVRIEAIINSMTPGERRNYSIINGSRRKRIALGSGTKVQDVNRLLKNYVQIMKTIKRFNKGHMRNFGKKILPY